MKTNGKYLMVGSSIFLIMGIPAGILLHSPPLLITELSVGLFFFAIGLAIFKGASP